jgi:hypothetical protein
MTKGPSDGSATMIGRRPAFQELPNQDTVYARYSKTDAYASWSYAQNQMSLWIVRRRGMIRNSGNRFSEKIVLHQNVRARTAGSKLN